VVNAQHRVTIRKLYHEEGNKPQTGTAEPMFSDFSKGGGGGSRKEDYNAAFYLIVF